jgi:hypothetical protein
MYKLIRNIHLVLGLASLLFLMMYSASAVQMAHRIRLTPTVAEEDIAAAPGLAARPLADALMRDRGYSGELGSPQMTPKGFRITITRPGTIYAVQYDRATGQAHVRKETRSFMGMLNRLHHQNGLHHADGVLNAWGWILLLVSVGLLVIGASGVYMWFQLQKERLIGTILLSLNLAVSLALLLALRL